MGEPRLIREGTVPLADGRFGIAEWGDADGAPVLYFHGTPGSRLEHPPAGGALDGIHQIGIDRPGIGLSDASPGRRIVDWSRVVSAVADHLGLDRFFVIGASGGGPYAAATAWALPDRVEGAALVSSGAPADEVDMLEGVTDLNAATYAAARDDPERLRTMLRLVADAFANGADPLSLVDAGALPAADRAALADPEVAAMLAADAREAFRQGIDGVLEDTVLSMRPWGFDCAEIETEVVVAHGALDANVPVACGEWLAGAIPNSTFLRYPDEGHVSTVANRIEEITAALLGR